MTAPSALSGTNRYQQVPTVAKPNGDLVLHVRHSGSMRQVEEVREVHGDNGAIFTPHLCLHCGRLVYRIHPAPSARFTASESTLTLRNDKPKVDARGVPIRRNAFEGARGVLALLRELPAHERAR